MKDDKKERKKERKKKKDTQQFLPCFMDALILLIQFNPFSAIEKVDLTTSQPKCVKLFLF